jgi:MFS family permease
VLTLNRANIERRDLWARRAVAITFFCHGFFFATWTAHIPQLKAALGISNSGLGLVLLAAPIGAVACLALAARVMPRFESRDAVRFAAVGYCLVGPLVGVSSTAAVCALALFLWGAFQAMLDMAMNTQAIALEHAQDRRLMSGLHGRWSLGTFAGAGVGVAGVAAGLSLTAQLAVLAVPILLLITWLTRFMVPDVERAANAGERSPAQRRSISRSVLALAAVAFAGLLCEGAAADWSAVYLRTELKTSAGFGGLGFTAFSLAMVSVRLAGDRLLTRFGAARLLPALAAIATVGLGAALIVYSPGATIIGYASLGLGVGLVVPGMFSAAGRLPGANVAAAVSTVAALSYLGFVAGPPLIGALAGLGSLRGALLVLPVLTGAIAVLAARTKALH